MRVIFRVLAVVISVVGLWAFAMLGGVFFAMPAKPGIFAAWMVSGAFAVLSVRCGLALWSERAFWRDRKRFADVIATVTAFVVIPVLVQIEQATDGTTQAVWQIVTVAGVVGVYLVSRRLALFSRASDAQIR